MSDKLLAVGEKAPAFSLKNQEGETVSLKDFAGMKSVVLYFYPKALTPGCTTQACSIRDSSKDFEKAGAVVLGVSADSVELIKKFQDTYDLNFSLLSDLGHKVADKYGVWGEKKSFGKVTQGMRRITFIIGKDGLVKHVMPKVNTKTHHDDVLEFLKEHKV